MIFSKVNQYYIPGFTTQSRSVLYKMNWFFILHMLKCDVSFTLCNLTDINDFYAGKMAGIILFHL